MVWPRDPMTWPDRLDKAQAAYLDAIRALQIRVDLVVHPEWEEHVRGLTADLDHVVVHVAEHQDSWIRDYGPTYLVNGEGARIGVKWRFNAWGNKYESLLFDNTTVDRLPELHLDELVRPDIVLEGGSIEVDGEGTLLTTKQCLLNPNRNPDMDQTTIERILMAHLGVTKVLWLGDGIEGDDTDGHVDDIARFVAPGHVVALEAPPGHVDHDALAANLDALRSMADAKGRFLKVTTLPVPEPLYADGQVLPASYANFLISNGVVLVPTFDAPTDAQALETLQACFPDRRIVGIPTQDLIWGMGAIHCLSQQIPAR